jgi:hypothetical protein
MDAFVSGILLCERERGEEQKQGGVLHCKRFHVSVELPGDGIACIPAQATSAEKGAFWNIGNRYASRKSQNPHP